MLPNLGGLSLRCAPTLTNAPATMGADTRPHESTNVNGRTKKQKVDPNEPSAEEKKAAYAARNAAPEHAARILETAKELQTAQATYFELIGEVHQGSADEELSEKMDAAEARVNELQSELEALKAAPAPMEVEPGLVPYQTEAQKRIGELHKNPNRTAEEEEELQSLRSGIKKARKDAHEESEAIRKLALAAAKLENRKSAIDDPKQWKKHLKKGLSQLPVGEKKWWEAMGQHMAAQKATVVRDARVQAAAKAAGRGPPPAAPRHRHRIVWPLDKLETKNERVDVVKALNKQLESMGLAEIEALQAEYTAREARLQPVRDQLKIDDAAAERAAKEAKAQAAEQAKQNKGKQHKADQRAQATSNKAAVAQDSLDKKARSKELARKDREAEAAAAP